MSRLLLTTLAVLALALSGRTASGAQEARQAPGNWPHLREVQQVFSSPKSPGSGQELTALGAAAAPAVWAVLSGRSRSPEMNFDSQACRQLAQKSIARWDAIEVIDELRSTNDLRCELGQRLVLVELLSWTDRSEALPSIFEILQSLDGIQMQSQRVGSQLERALAELLSGNPRRFRKLDKLVAELPDHLLKPVIVYAGKSSSAEAASFLSRTASQSPFAERLVLESIARKNANSMEWVPEAFLPIAQRALDQDDVLSRRLGIRALGTLRDSTSFLRLVEVYEQEEGSLHRTALGVIQEMSGMRRDWDGPRWREWLETELNRLEQDKAGAHGIASLDPGAALVAIRTLTTHKLFAKDAVEMVGNALSHADPNVRLLACRALSELRHTRAIRLLVDRLDDADERVRTSALTSLQQLTGRDFGPERLAWEEWLLSLG